MKEKSTMNKDDYKDYFAAYIGRFNPTQLGHEVVGNTMIDLFGLERSRFIVGSANASQSLRHFFSYAERRLLLGIIFPGAQTLPLCDFPSDDEWITALDDLLLSSGMPPKKTIFFGGCEEDISFFLKLNRKCHILNRFDGTTPKVSATEVRDALVHRRSLDGLLNPSIHEVTQNLFDKKWIEFQKK